MTKSGGTVLTVSNVMYNVSYIVWIHNNALLSMAVVLVQCCFKVAAAGQMSASLKQTWLHRCLRSPYCLLCVESISGILKASYIFWLIQTVGAAGSVGGTSLPAVRGASLKQQTKICCFDFFDDLIGMKAGILSLTPPGNSSLSSSHLLGVTPVMQNRLNQASNNQVKANLTHKENSTFITNKSGSKYILLFIISQC